MVTGTGPIRPTAWRGPSPDRAAVGVIGGRAGCGGRVGLLQCGLPVTLAYSGWGPSSGSPVKNLAAMHPPRQEP